MMIVFHSFFDLNLFGYYSIDLYSGFWMSFARIIEIIFIFLVGISLTISYSRSKEKSFTKYLKRGLKIFSWGLLITIMTWLFFKERFVLFGILHFIGIAIIFAYPFVKFMKPALNIILGAIIIFLGICILNLRFNFPYLLWLGFLPYNFHTLDYFPIFPWFGVVLLGVSSGKILYPNGNRIINLPELSRFKIVRLLKFLGQHSLFIYLIHHLIIIALLHIFFL